MLKNAKNYELEVQALLRDAWYDPHYQYYFSSSYHDDMVFSKDYMYYFVSLDSEKNILGFISYRIDRDINGVNNLGIISFKEGGSAIFAKDVLRVIDDIFNKYHFNRLSWFCIEGNPALEHYKKFCAEHGGEIVSHEHRCVRTLDGVVRDSYGFEILGENYY